jgi:hypothetical protein
MRKILNWVGKKTCCLIINNKKFLVEARHRHELNTRRQAIVELLADGRTTVGPYYVCVVRAEDMAGVLCLKSHKLSLYFY